MKKPLFTLILLFFTAALSTTACKKDEKSAEENLVAATCWNISKAEAFNPITNTWVDATEDAFEACDLDDCIKFNSDKTAVVNFGAIKCDSSDPVEYESGTWSISSDGKTLTLTADTGDVEIYGIVEISSTRMIIELTEVSTGATIRFTFSS